jgi:hypothetical protein
MAEHVLTRPIAAVAPVRVVCGVLGSTSGRVSRQQVRWTAGRVAITLPTWDKRMRLHIAASSIAWALTLAACGSLSTDGSDENSNALACIDEHGLVPGVLRLELAPARAWLIEDGVEIELPLEGGDPPERMVGLAAGDYIAVARIDEPSDYQKTTVHVFSRSSGERLWMRDIDGSAWDLHMSDDGWLSGHTWDLVPHGFVMSETKTITLPNHRPLAPPTLGHVATSAHEQGVGWIDLDDFSWEPVTPPPPPFVTVTIADDHHTLEYLAFTDGAFTFVRARPGEAEIITLPFVVPEESVEVLASNDRYRVVHRARYWYEPPDIDYLRIDVQSGDLELVEPRPPPGWGFQDCMGRRETGLDGDGRLYFALRSISSVQAWAYDLEDEAWTPVGHPVADVENFSISSKWQNLALVRAAEEGDCSGNPWPEPPVDALIGNSTQIVRREPALTMVVPSAPPTIPPWIVSPSIDGQQRCVASIEGDGWKVRPLDGSDAVIDLGPGLGDWLWLD